MNNTGLNIITSAAAVRNLGPVRPQLRFSRTKKFVTSGAKHFTVFAAVAGIETLMPSYMYPGLSVQLCMGIPSMVQTVRNQRLISATAATMFWFIMYKGIGGIIETIIIPTNTTRGQRLTNSVGKLADKYIRGSANRNSAKYLILYYFAQFVRAWYLLKGLPVKSANSFGKEFAATMSGHLGSQLTKMLKTGVYNYPLTTTAAVTALAVSRSRRRRSSRQIKSA
jgi:hypothetical protein